MTEQAGGRSFVVRWREWLRDSDEHWSTRYVGQVMSYSMSSTGRGATMSLEKLIDQTGLSRSQVKRARARLVEGKWVTCTPGGGRGMTNRYDATKPVLTKPVPVETGPQETGSEPEEGVHQKPVLVEKGVLEPLERGPQPNGNGSSQDPEVVVRNRNHEVGTTAAGGRKPDEVWDALVAVCGIDATQLTKPARGALNAAVKHLRDVSATPALIAERGEQHLRQWPNVTLTPSSLAKNWAQLAARPQPVAGAVKDVAGAEAFLARARSRRPS